MAEVTQILCPICHKTNLLRARFCQHCGNDVVLNNDSPTDDARYWITRVIKEGGQGAVYEGVDQHGRVYAIKEMLDRFTDPKERDEAIVRFNQEAKLLQGLSHPRIPRVYSHFTDEGRHYLTMDFVRGEDLDQIVERAGPLPEDQVLEWADQICDVLVYLHGKGLVYRDMKPSNVMIERGAGTVKLVDFGIAKLFKPNERGTQIGTPGYAPPEQYQGIATPASDIYALGATLHHLLTGRDPTEEAPFSFPPARNVNPKVSRRTSDALEQALKMKPEDRVATVAEFRALLRPLAAQPTQVRVAQPTVALPASAQVAAAPTPAAGAVGRQPPAAPPAPSRPTPAAPAPRPVAAPAQPAHPAPVQPATRQGVRQSHGWSARLLSTLGRAFVALLLLVVIALAGVYIFLPDVANTYLPPLPPAIEQLLPGRQQQTTVPLTTVQMRVDVEVLVPAGADNSQILAALRDAYARRVQNQNPGAVINTGTVSIVGPVQQLGEESGQVRYQATMQGYVQIP